MLSHYTTTKEGELLLETEPPRPADKPETSAPAPMEVDLTYLTNSVLQTNPGKENHLTVSEEQGLSTHFKTVLACNRGYFIVLSH